MLVSNTRQEVAASSLTVMRIVFWPVPTEDYWRGLTTIQLLPRKTIRMGDGRRFAE
jgi:hypothetical protein